MMQQGKQEEVKNLNTIHVEIKSLSNKLQKLFDYQN